ncbi:hypothetical protein [Dyadobacter aurulentus]|uniref:hypothetical protein n=1 Tax=Dyadobacter sp. UC 10 TaxID=2605428 RepID=UPI0011F3E60F|nr:hypothetical protein [Dyadobacter sp. UC 10]KAA0990473.1 hypothetical protein FXO21_10055 [Dyadobacter sp. UC 10]
MADNVIANKNLTVDSGYISLSTYRFLTVKKASTGELNSFVGPNSGNLTTTGKLNSFFGENAGMTNAAGNQNTFLGTSSGTANTSGSSNTFVGYRSGFQNTTGQYNSFLGTTSGNGNTTGSSNVFVGLDAGYGNSSGSNNVYIGRGSGLASISGANNTYIGFGSGYTSTGSRNVFIGNFAGQNELGNDKLYIANTGTTTPLIYGEFATASPVSAGKLVFNSPVGIAGTGGAPFPATATTGTGTVNTSQYKLFVNGGVLAKELTVSNTWADYVFEKDYQLRPLSEVEEYINTNGHLPNIPSSRLIEKHGLNLGDMARRQQEKIEELTLYIIEHDKLIKKNDELIEEQSAALDQVRVLMNKLEKR